MPTAPLLEVQDLSLTYRSPEGPVPALQGVNLQLHAGERVGVVGESGCGKSSLALSILRLHEPHSTQMRGRVLFDGQDLTTVSERAMQQVRGARISIVFQEPMSSLNPVFRVGWQIMEAVRIHQRVSRGQARERAATMLARVGMSASHLDAYPHQLSGGMRQRVMVAMALACDPKVLLADEPTTALDATVQAQILDLLRRLQESTQTAVLLITHDLKVLADFAQRVVVMYAGRVVEQAPVEQIFWSPLHPYTHALLQSLPTAATPTSGSARRLPTIAGQVPDMRQLPSGCPFRTRCPRADAQCANAEPPLEQVMESRRVRCFHHMEAR